MATLRDILVQKKRTIYTKIEILDSSESKVLYELSSDATDGNYNLDSSADIRRTSSLSFVLKDSYLPSSNSPFWINRKYKLSIGIKTSINNEPCWFNMGVYLISDPEMSISISSSKISIKGLDKVALLNGNISGTLFGNYAIAASTQDNPLYVYEAIQAVLTDSEHSNTVENKLIIGKQDAKYVVPYKIEKNIGEQKWDLIKELTELYYNYQSYYDNNGYFRYEEKPMYETYSYPIAWDFSNDDLIVSIDNYNVKYSNVKNVVKVYGKVGDDSYQPSYTIEVHDREYPNCKYTIEALNEDFTRDYVVTDDNYYNEEQCKARAESEVWLHQNTNDELTFNCIPLYNLNVGDVIYFNGYYGKEQIHISGRFVIDTISCGLKYDSLMSIKSHRLDNTVMNEGDEMNNSALNAIIEKNKEQDIKIQSLQNKNQELSNKLGSNVTALTESEITQALKEVEE